MKKVIIESPYAGNLERNIEYAKMCLADSLSRGEAPIASHLLYTQVLDDLKPNERQTGIDAGLEWLKVADLHVFYLDYGWSLGMLHASQKSYASKIEVETRKIL